MYNVPSLSLKDITLDAELVRLLPSKLAYYHLALPLAADDGQITLAMAHPDNPLVIEMLGKLLGASIVPIRADATEIRFALDQVWQTAKTLESNILTWGSSGHYALRAHQNGTVLSPIFGAQVHDFQGNDLDHVLMLTQQDHYMLTVMSGSISENLLPIVRQAGTPVLLLFGDPVERAEPSFARILLSLRGHSPDLSALNLVAPLASASQAEVTVLAVTDAAQKFAHTRLSHGLTALLDPDQEAAQHLARCTSLLVTAGILGYLKLCQGDPVQQIVTEYTKGQYSLLVITSEAFGEFVQQVIETLQSQTDHMAVLVVKPGLSG
jgi:hypothetical protein